MNPLRLLVVDDDADICEIIRQVAEQLGFEVAVAYDAEGFRTTYATFSPTHVTLDLRLPGGAATESSCSGSCTKRAAAPRSF